MTDEEAQQALDQQTPVMWDCGAIGADRKWCGPYMVGHEAQPPRRHGWRMWVLSAGQWVYSDNLRLATPHELLTAEESG